MEGGGGTIGLELWDGRVVEVRVGETVLGRGGPWHLTEDKRCSRRQAVLTITLANGCPSLVLVAHGPNRTYLKRTATEERVALVRGQPYTLRIGDALLLPPDYRPITLRQLPPANSESQLNAPRNDLVNTEMIYAQDTPGGEDSESKAGGLLALLPEYRPLTLAWQSARSCHLSEDPAANTSTTSSSSPESNDPEKNSWIRRKRKSEESGSRDMEIRASVEIETKVSTISDTVDSDSSDLISKKRRIEEDASTTPPDAGTRANDRRRHRVVEEEEEEVHRHEKCDTSDNEGSTEAIAVLRSMFAELSEAELRKVLRDHGGDMDRSIDHLLTVAAIRRGEAGSLSMEDIEGNGSLLREPISEEGSDAERELNESEERIVDEIKEAFVEAVAEVYMRKNEGRDLMEEEKEEDDEMESEKGATVDPPWACAQCTFLNNASEDKCAICDGDRKLSNETSTSGSPLAEKGKERIPLGEPDTEEDKPDREEPLDPEEQERIRRENEERERRELEKSRRDKLEREDEELAERSPGYNLRKVFPSTQERLYYNSQALTVLPRQVARFKSLTMLNLDDNDLEWLPEEIGELTSLRALFINRNRIKRLPLELSRLNCLEWIHAANNLIEEVGEELHGLSSLARLHLEYNAITSVSSAALATLVGLRQLVLQHNRLTEIPDALRALPNLAQLDLSQNMIAVIPPSLFIPEDDILPTLEELRLDSNPLRWLPSSFLCFLEQRRLRELHLRLCKFNELMRETRWDKRTDGTDQVVIWSLDTPVVPLFEQCLTFLYRSDKEAIDDWGLPDSVCSHLRTHLSWCAGCNQAFVGKGVAEVMRQVSVDPSLSAAFEGPHVPVQGKCCSLRCVGI